MSYSPLIKELIDALRCLPSVGPKSAQRMAFQLLHKDKEKGLHLSASLEKAIQQIRRCDLCRMLCEEALCELCQNSKREKHIICVVESPSDVPALEKTLHYRGLYFVLFGKLSPLDGIGPHEIGLNLLFERIKTENIQEIIIATGSTVEGNATAHYIAQRADILCSRIAYGIPAGGELEYLDEVTLSYALNARTPLQHEKEESI